jgi:hypothetical protein
MFVNQFYRILVLVIIALVVVFAAVTSIDTTADSSGDTAPANRTGVSNLPQGMGVSGPVEQGDAGFGAASISILYREAGVSGPVEIGDAGFGALSIPVLSLAHSKALKKTCTTLGAGFYC